MSQITWDQIFNAVQIRRSADAPLIVSMLDIRDRYNLDFHVPLRTAEGEPELPPLAPQIIHDGIEHTSLRAAGPQPTITVPALEYTQETGKKSREYADLRRKALYACWHYNLLNLLMYRFYRHLIGYGTAAMVVLPDFETKRAKLEIRNPLNAYPEPRSHDDMMPPRNVAFIYGRSSDWLLRNVGAEVMSEFSPDPYDTGLWDIVEWQDEECIVLGVLGPRSPFGVDLAQTGPRGTELRRWPNRAGMCTAAVPRRITLDRMAGQLNAATGMADWLERLVTLNTIAAEKNIFPDVYAIGKDNAVAEISGGEWKDGRTGEINLLTGVQTVGQLVSTVGPMTQQAIGGLERAARTTTGTIPQFGGENPQSLRTGRAIDTLGSYSVDPRIKEAQDIAATYLERSVNPSILEVEKGYWPNKKYVCFSGWAGDTGHVEYTPAKHFETNENVVAYSFPGMDLSQISVAVLQLNGGELMSKKTARIKHPMIDDPGGEEKSFLEEGLEKAWLASLQKQVAEGSMNPVDFARIWELVLDGEPVHRAMQKAQQEAQERQVAEPPPPEPGQVAPPESAPGLAQPGQGVEGPPGSPESAQRIPAPQEEQLNLRELIRAVKTR